MEDVSRSTPLERRVAESTVAALAHVIEQLPDRQRIVLSLLHFEKLDYGEVAEVISATAEDVEHLHKLAVRAIHGWFPDLPLSAKMTALLKSWPESPRVQEVVAQVRALTPGLIRHLRSHKEDTINLRPDVFEHVVGEFLVQNGFSDVRHLGRVTSTSADIIAISRTTMGQEVRFFVEVKRWRNRVGIEIVNQVAGAMVLEEPEYGWHAALIVSLGGFKKLKKLDEPRLEKRRISLKDKDDIFAWMDKYEPNKDGLWLPKEVFEANDVTRPTQR